MKTRQLLAICYLLCSFVSVTLCLAQPAEKLPVQASGQSAQAQTQAPNTLPESTPVRMRINRTVSSANAQVGENVDFETLDDIKLGDVLVIPKSSTAIATIT